jgi:hypothetical protein
MIDAMSAIGPKRTFQVALHMSAFGGKADISRTLNDQKTGAFPSAGLSRYDALS